MKMELLMGVLMTFLVLTDHPDVASYLKSVSKEFNWLGNHKEALQYAKKALEMAQGLHPKKDNFHVAWKLTSLGIELDCLGEHKEALRYKTKGLEMAHSR